MIDVIVVMDLSDKNIGHHWHCPPMQLGYKKRKNGGMKVIPNKPHKLGRHPFNIITEEIYD